VRGYLRGERRKAGSGPNKDLEGGSPGSQKGQRRKGGRKTHLNLLHKKGIAKFKNRRDRRGVLNRQGETGKKKKKALVRKLRDLSEEESGFCQVRKEKTEEGEDHSQIDSAGLGKDSGGIFSKEGRSGVKL